MSDVVEQLQNYRAHLDRDIQRRAPEAETEQSHAPRPGPNRINDRQPSHDLEATMRSNDTPPSRRRWPLLGAAAGLIAVAIVGIVVAARDTDDPDPPVATAPPPPPTLPAPSIELRGADDNPEAIEAFTAVSAAYDSFNAGDIEAWATSTIEEGYETDPSDNEFGYLLAARAAGAQYDIEYCDYVGLIEADVAPDEATEPNIVTGHAFDCAPTMADAFTDAAGINFVEEWRWLVTDEGLFVPDGGGFDSRLQLQEFMTDFWAWVAREHPDFRVEVSPYLFYLYPEPENVPRAVELLDDFVAADDRWPLTSE